MATQNKKTPDPNNSTVRHNWMRPVTDKKKAAKAFITFKNAVNDTSLTVNSTRKVTLAEPYVITATNHVLNVGSNNEHAKVLQILEDDEYLPANRVRIEYPLENEEQKAWEMRCINAVRVRIDETLDTLNQKRSFARVLGATDSRNMSLNKVDIWLFEFAERRISFNKIGAELMWDAIANPTREDTEICYEAAELASIVNTGLTYSAGKWKYESQVIGTTVEEAVSWLHRDENKNILSSIHVQINEYHLSL